MTAATIKQSQHGLFIRDDLYGSITVTDRIEGATLWVYEVVRPEAIIQIADMVTDSNGIHSEVKLGSYGGEQYDFEGQLVLENGVPANQLVWIYWAATTGSTIDLNMGDVGGILYIWYGGPADIINGGTITATGSVAPALAGIATYSGTVTFAGVDNGGIISLGGTQQRMAGDFHITGAMAGKIKVSDELLPAGRISVDGFLGATGQITVSGLCDGNIVIGKSTISSSLISLPGGLGLNGIVTVNDTQGGFHAEGTIHVGPDVQNGQEIVTFDGSIRIMKKLLGPGGGLLLGVIKVVGCHATAADLDICICGDNLGTVEIVQDGCDPQVGWSCISNVCPGGGGGGEE